MGGGGEMQVTSIETRGQLDAGWLAATIPPVLISYMEQVIVNFTTISSSIEERANIFTNCSSTYSY